jgi:hypothetical protein
VEIFEPSFAHNLDRAVCAGPGCADVKTSTRVISHIAGHNLGIQMRLLIGAPTPREAAAPALTYLLFVYTEQTVALILVVASDDGFAVLVTVSPMIQPDQTGTSATGC